jgi:hypothetical protein
MPIRFAALAALVRCGVATGGEVHKRTIPVQNSAERQFHTALNSVA